MFNNLHIMQIIMKMEKEYESICVQNDRYDDERYDDSYDDSYNDSYNDSYDD